MKKNFKAFLNFYELLADAEEELGIETLTKKDKVILTEIIKLSYKNDNILLNYRAFEKKIIIKIGLKRSGTFRLAT